MTVIASSVVRRDFLDPAMESIALGYSEGRLLSNGTPEIDCLEDVAVALSRDGADPGELALLWRLLRDLKSTNLRQVGCDLLIAGAADDLAIDLHARERAGLAVDLVGVHAAAELLRPALDVLQDDAADRMAVVAAVRRIDALLAQVPRAQLLTGALAHQLGKTKYALLCELALGRIETMEHAAA